MNQLDPVVAVLATLVSSYYGCAVLISILLEIAAQVLGRRARMLRSHLVQVLGPNLAREILNNPLIRKVRDDIYAGQKGVRNSLRVARHRLKGLKGNAVAVAYIEPRDFALALMREGFTGQDRQGRSRALRIKPGLPAHSKQLLETLLQDTNDNAAHIQERLEAWFRRDQQQLTASYGTNSRLWGIALGTAIAALVGLDTIEIALRCVASPTGYPCLADGLHSRWQTFQSQKWDRELRTVLGYLVSGLMISQGAAFWFDIISKVANVRSEGKRP